MDHPHDHHHGDESHAHGSPHEHGHAHDHGHHHGHAHEVTDFSRAFAVGIALNLVFVLVESVYGLAAHSLALLADAGHNLGDVLGLFLAWGAFYLARKQPSQRRTYGFRRVTILASLVSAVLLLVALGGITWEAVLRLWQPAPVNGVTVMTVAAIGVVINTATALMFMKGQHHDLNVRGAFLHMAADAAISLGVVLSGLLILKTGWLWLDPAISLAIVVVILWGTWGLLRDSLAMIMDTVPAHIDPVAVEHFLREQPCVVDLHDLHIWPMSTTEVALTVHLSVDAPAVDNDFLRHMADKLREGFGIGHATIQVERAEAGMYCRLAEPGSL